MTKIIPYSCIRCGYTTKHKTKMTNHLFERKKYCPAIVNNIKLTEEIKNFILENRVYKIPKKTTITQNIEAETENHYIYLIRPKENVNHGENVYKLGKTISKELTINVSRLTSYGKGTELILICKCKDSAQLEDYLLIEFEKYFEKHKYGNEYFIGDVKDMCDIIYTELLK